jgi:hypothetical protein
MTERTELLEGVYLRILDTGSTIDLATKNRRYRIEYLEADRVRISGHPEWCPTPTLARIWGSKGGSEGFEAGYIGCGMHLVFEPLDNRIPITTSEITGIRVIEQN